MAGPRDPAATAPIESVESVEILSLFPTPIGVAVLPDSAEINRALGRQIAARHGPDDVSTGQAWMWDDGLVSAGGTPLARILDAARTIAGRMTPGDGTPRWRIACRAHVLCRNQSVAFHIHPGSIWSATYFIDDGGANADPAVGGILEFQDPRGSEPVMYAPSMTFAVPGGETMGIAQTIVPSPGALILYPSWLQHGVGIYLGPGRRVSITAELFADSADGA